jgi:predicted alpha/beta-hydrolase family hydrolase
MLEMLFDGPKDATLRIALAHGAGAGMDSPFMNALAAALGERGIRVARFEFPYMQKRRRSGARTPPDRAAVLLQTWRDAVTQLGGGAQLFVGGKSMGGRIASMVADELGVRGVICLGYPFHPPLQPTKTRTEHLQRLKTRCLIVQGTRDPFGTPAEVRGYALSRRIRIEWIEDGDHSLATRRKLGHDPGADLARSWHLIAQFLRRARK